MKSVVYIENSCIFAASKIDTGAAVLYNNINYRTMKTKKRKIEFVENWICKECQQDGQCGTKKCTIENLADSKKIEIYNKKYKTMKNKKKMQFITMSSLRDMSNEELTELATKRNYTTEEEGSTMYRPDLIARIMRLQLDNGLQQKIIGQ